MFFVGAESPVKEDSKTISKIVADCINDCKQYNNVITCICSDKATNITSALTSNAPLRLKALVGDLVFWIS